MHKKEHKNNHEFNEKLFVKLANNKLEPKECTTLLEQVLKNYNNNSNNSNNSSSNNLN